MWDLKTPERMATLVAERFMQQGVPRLHYANGVTLYSLLRLRDVTGDDRYLDYVVSCYDHYLREEAETIGQVEYSHNMTALVEPELYLRTGEERYLDLVRTRAEALIDRHPRSHDGGYCYHVEPERGRIWVDILNGTCPLLVRAGKILGEGRYYDDAVSQIEVYSRRLQDPQTKLYYQGWGWGINPDARSTGFWGRGVGWVLMAGVEILEFLPLEHSRRVEMFRWTGEFIDGLIGYQGPSGAWYQLVDRADSYEETSGTAMITYGIARAIRRGWVDAGHLKAVVGGIRALSGKVRDDGAILGTCIGTGTQDRLEDYYVRSTPVDDNHGPGPVILACCEVLELEREFPKDP